MPSMVVTLEPAACPASTVQDLTARPSICTTQAPHWLVSQPTWVPARFRFSRKSWTSSVRSSTSTETALPFTVNLTVDTRDTSRCFVIFPIRSRGAELCNQDFCRVRPCDRPAARVGGLAALGPPLEGEGEQGPRHSRGPPQIYSALSILP